VVHHRVGWLNWFFIGLSWIGTDGAVFLVVAAVLALLWRRPRVFVLVAAADLVAQLLSLGLRDWIDRRRPSLVYPEPRPLVHVPHSGSFPSGHATAAFACATVIAWQAPRLAFPAFVLAGAIAWSRVYDGVHWPLDVVGGAALGLLIATALLMLVGVRPRSRPETQAG
jgi:undecaprenyl-diphosphatase